MFALPGVPAGKLLVNLVEDAELFAAPVRADQHIGRAVAGEPADHELWREQLELVADDLHIGFAGEQREFLCCKRFGKRCARDHMQQMDFHEVQFQPCEQTGGLQHDLMRLPRQSVDDVHPDRNTACAQTGISLQKIGETITPIERRAGLIVGGL